MFYMLYDKFIYYLHRAYQLSQANSNAKRASNMLFKFTLFPILETIQRESRFWQDKCTILPKAFTDAQN